MPSLVAGMDFQAMRWPVRKPIAKIGLLGASRRFRSCLDLRERKPRMIKKGASS